MDEQGVEEFILEYAAKKGMTGILQDILERRGMESFQVLFLAPIRLFLAVVLVIIEKDDVVVFRRVIKILKLINKKMKGSESKHLKVSHSSKIIRELKRRIVLDKISRKESTEDAYSLIDKYFPYIRIHPNKQTLKERRDSVDRFQTQEVREQLLSIVCRNEYRNHEVPSAEKKFLVQQVKNYVREVNDDLAPTKIEQLSSRNGRFQCDVHDFFNNEKSERKGIYKRLVSICMAGLPSENDLYSLLREIWNEDGPKKGKTRRKLRRDEEFEELDNVGENSDERREEDPEDLHQGAVLYKGDISTPTCLENGVRSRQIADSLYLKIMKEVMESDNEAENEETRRNKVLSRSDLSNRSKDLDQSMEQSYSVTQDLDRDFIESTYPSRSGIRSRRQSSHARSDVPHPRTSTPGVDSHCNQTRKVSPGGERDYNQSSAPSPGVFNDRHQTRRQSPRDHHRSRGQSPDGHSRALNQSGTPSPKAGNHLGVSRISLLDDDSHCNHARKQSPDANNHCTQSNIHSIYESRVFNKSSNQAPMNNVNLKSRRQSPKRQAPDNVKNLKSRRRSPRRQAPDGIISLNESSRQSPRRQAPDDIRDLVWTPDIRDLDHSSRHSPRRQIPSNRDLHLAPNDIRDVKDSRKQSPGIQFPDDIRDIKTRRQSPIRQAPDDIRDLNESRRHSPRRQAPDDIISLNESRRQSPNRQTPDDIRHLNSRRQSPRRQAPDDIINLNDHGGQSPKRQTPNDISLLKSRRQSSRRQAPDDIISLKESRRHSPRRQAPDNISLNESTCRRQSPRRQAVDDIINLDDNGGESPKRQSPNDIINRQSRRQSPRRQAPDDIISLKETRRHSLRRQAPDDISLNESICRRQSPRRQAIDDIINLDDNGEESLERQSPNNIINRQSRRQSPRRQAPDDILSLKESRRQSPKRQAPDDICLNESTCRRQSPKRQAFDDIIALDDNGGESPKKQAPDDISHLKSRRQSLRRQAPDSIINLDDNGGQSPKRLTPNDISHLKSRRQSLRRQAPDDIINLDDYRGQSPKRQAPDDIISLKESRSQSPRSQALNDFRDFNESRRQSLRKQPSNYISQDHHEESDEDIEEPMDTDSDDFDLLLVQGAACKQKQESPEMTLCRPRRCSVILKDCKDLCIEKLGEWNVEKSLKVAKGHSPSNDHPSRLLHLPPCSIMKELHTKGQGKGGLSEVRKRSSPPRTEMSHTSFMAMLGLTPTSKVKASDAAVVNEVKQRSPPITNTDSPLGTLRLRRCSVVMVKLEEVMEGEEAENQTSASPTISYSGQEEVVQNIPFIQDHDRVMEVKVPASPSITVRGHEVGDQSSSSFEDHNGVMKEAPVSPFIIDSDQEEGNQSTSFLLDHNGMMEGAPCSVADSGQEVEDQSTPFLLHDNRGTVEQAVKDLKRRSPQINKLNLSRCVRLRGCSVRLRKYKKSAATHIRRLILRRVSGPSIFKIKNYVRMSIHTPHCGRIRLRQRLPASGLYM